MVGKLSVSAAPNCYWRLIQHSELVVKDATSGKVAVSLLYGGSAPRAVTA